MIYLVKSCNNCTNLVLFPKNNRYGDVDYFCIETGYYVTGKDKDVTKVKRYSPGGKELKCKWRQK